MATLKQEAEEYIPQQTKNIADLEVVDVNLELTDHEKIGQDGPFKYKSINVNGEEYRVPGKVIGDLKEILKLKPDLKTFRVSKKGTGLQTTYTVIPLE